ncbi:unnamed protein product [Parnassius apollo]|uniref:(apollo) hypothetical protein n=1 Tax=Parnassius apollo TaxID=110799 RepID=A0A8S3WPT4_PARAO|nr:unnamed protein product [Parnassius apollo]
MVQFAIRRLWKGHRRKSSKNFPPVELTVDSSIGIHCYIKVMGVKYHYVETGPKNGQIVVILGDAPDAGNLWVPSWSSVVRRLAESGHHVITLDLRGTGGSEGGYRRDLAPPKAVEELSALLQALGVSVNNPAVVIGFGIGGMLTWYLAHCRGALIRKFIVIGAPHPNLYWQYPPAPFCQQALYFIQWPYLPERWLAEGSLQDDSSNSPSSRARDWNGALNYVRGAAWWRVGSGRRVAAPGLLLGARRRRRAAGGQRAVLRAPRLETHLQLRSRRRRSAQPGAGLCPRDACGRGECIGSWCPRAGGAHVGRGGGPRPWPYRALRPPPPPPSALRTGLNQHYPPDNYAASNNKECIAYQKASHTR